MVTFTQALSAARERNSETSARRSTGTYPRSRRMLGIDCTPHKSIDERIGRRVHLRRTPPAARNLARFELAERIQLRLGSEIPVADVRTDRSPGFVQQGSTPRTTITKSRHRIADCLRPAAMRQRIPQRLQLGADFRKRLAERLAVERSRALLSTDCS